MSPILPFDVIEVIIDIVGENRDTDLLKELALVSHSLHQICIKHLFANIDLHDADPNCRLVSSKNGFVQLLKSRPHLVKYIRKIKYEAGHNHDDHLLSPILLNFLPTTSRLNCLEINASNWDWNILDASLTSAFLHLISLPTINHIALSFVKKFPLSILSSSVNLLRLDMTFMTSLEHMEEDYYFKTVESEMLPKIREFHTSNSRRLTKKLLHVKGQDGRQIFDFTDLRQLSIIFADFEDKRNIQCLLEKAKLLERLHLSVDSFRLSLVGILSTSARTLKVLDLTIPMSFRGVPPLAGAVGLCEELKVMAGHNSLEALSVKFEVIEFLYLTEDAVGSTIQEVGNVLVEPGWPSLRQVSFKLYCGGSTVLFKALQSLPDKYLSRLSKLDSVAFNYLAYLDYY